MNNKLILTTIVLLISSCSNETDDDVTYLDGGRYQKINQNGEIIAIDSGPWSCVTDNHSGLTWEVKTDDEGIHHSNWTYTFQRTEKKINTVEGNCNKAQIKHCTTQGLVRSVNQQAYCGYQDWRLPTLDELQSIIDRDVLEQEAMISKCLFPHTQRSSYWSNSPSLDIANAIRSLNFATAEITHQRPSVPMFVRLVRGTLDRSGQEKYLNVPGNTIR